MRHCEANHILSPLPEEPWTSAGGLTSDLPKSVRPLLSCIPLAVPAVDGQGWGAYLVPLPEGAPESVHPGLGLGAATVT